MRNIFALDIKENGMENTVIFDMNKVELIERRDHQIFIFVDGKTVILEYEEIDSAAEACIIMYNFWKGTEKL